jgi:outer membrane protein assembly factor BamB
VEPGTVDVELAEEAGRTDAPADRDPTAVRRAGVVRVLRRWWPVPVAVVLGVVGWQALSDRADRAATEALRATPGVIGTTLTPPLTTTAWGSADAIAVLADPVRTADGALAGPVLAPTGGWDVVALDAEDGHERWRAAVTEPEPRAGTSAFVTCEGEGEPARGLACLVQTERYDPGPGELAVASRLVRVDLAAGTVQPVRDLPPGATAAVADDLLVLAENRPGSAGGPGSIRVTATDLGTGDPRWRVEVPGAFPTALGAPAVRWLDGYVLVHGPASAWALDPGDGGVRASGADLQVLRDGQVADVAGNSTTRLFGADGEPGATLPGSPVGVDPDDGSVPDLLVQRRYDGAAGGTLEAVDGATGAQVWQVALDRDLASSVVLLDGVLYVADGPTVRAFDAATGRERWATAGGPDDGARLTSDGVHLLRVERDMATGDQVLAAYALGDGGRTWATPLPEQVDALLVRDGRLYGQHDRLLHRVG